MNASPASPVRITLRDTVYKAIDPDTGLGLRACNSPPRLDGVDVCTFFRTRIEAEQFIAARFGASTLEIVRFDK